MTSAAGTTRHPRILGVLAATMALIVAACGGTAGSPTTAPASSGASAPVSSAGSGTELEGTISFLHKYSDPRYAPYFESVVAAYMAEHPKVTIEIQAESDQGVKDKLRILAASNTLPDVYFSWAGDFTKKFVRGNLAKDLTADVTGDWASSFTPAALEAYTYDGKLYGVPITLDAKYLVYNKQLFAGAGVAVPTTLEELLTACDTFKAGGVTDPITFGNVNGWPAIHFITQLNPYFVPAATMATDYDPATGVFTDPGYQKALEAFADINAHCLSQGANGITHEAAQAQFLAGRSPMHYIEAVEFFALTEKGEAPADLAANWEFVKLPAPAAATGDTGYLTGAPDGFLVNPSSQHLDIAIDFLKYLTSLDNATKMVGDLGWLSPVQGSATADNTFPQNVRVIEDIATADGMAIWLDTVTHIDVANAYLNGVQAMLDGTKTAADVVADVQAAAAKAKAETQ
jgi:raffinose/stachyose/melibiose transport system substrate-binding protein